MWVSQILFKKICIEPKYSFFFFSAQASTMMHCFKLNNHFILTWKIVSMADWNCRTQIINQKAHAFVVFNQLVYIRYLKYIVFLSTRFPSYIECIMFFFIFLINNCPFAWNSRLSLITKQEKSIWYLDTINFQIGSNSLYVAQKVVHNISL